MSIHHRLPEDGTISCHMKGNIPLDHTLEMESYHTMGMESYHGIIPWSWNHTIEIIHGHGIIPWNHTKAVESYQGHGIIPWKWDHTMESYQGHGIIPRQNDTRDFLTGSYIKTSLFKITCRSKQTEKLTWYLIQLHT